jgi:hypothetical protein
MAPPVPLFPATPSIAFAEDGKMKRALEIARDELKKARSNVTPTFRLAIIEFSSTELFGSSTFAS